MRPIPRAGQSPAAPQGSSRSTAGSTGSAPRSSEPRGLSIAGDRRGPQRDAAFGEALSRLPQADHGDRVGCGFAGPRERLADQAERARPRRAAAARPRVLPHRRPGGLRADEGLRALRRSRPRAPRGAPGREPTGARPSQGGCAAIRASTIGSSIRSAVPRSSMPGEARRLTISSAQLPIFTSCTSATGRGGRGGSSCAYPNRRASSYRSCSTGAIASSPST